MFVLIDRAVDGLYCAFVQIIKKKNETKQNKAPCQVKSSFLKLLNKKYLFYWKTVKCQLNDLLRRAGWTSASKRSAAVNFIQCTNCTTFHDEPCTVWYIHIQLFHALNNFYSLIKCSYLLDLLIMLLEEGYYINKWRMINLPKKKYKNKEWRRLEGGLKWYYKKIMNSPPFRDTTNVYIEKILLKRTWELAETCYTTKDKRTTLWVG